MMAVREVGRAPGHSSDAVVRADRVRVSFGDVTALDRVDLAVRPGEVHALVGLNGAGKTTLMRALVGMVHPVEGSLEVLGASLDKAGRNVWSRVGHMIDHPFGYPELTVRENAVASARLHGLPVDVARDQARTWTEALGVDRYSATRAARLSQGNRQRLGLACALAHEPAVLLLDEPTNALDPAGIITLRDLILNKAAQGTGILVSSHHLDEVSRIANRISVLHAGRIVGGLSPGTSEIERAFFAMVHAHDHDRWPAT